MDGNNEWIDNWHRERRSKDIQTRDRPNIRQGESFVKHCRLKGISYNIQRTYFPRFVCLSVHGSAVCYTAAMHDIDVCGFYYGTFLGSHYIYQGPCIFINTWHRNSIMFKISFLCFSLSANFKNVQSRLRLVLWRNSYPRRGPWSRSMIWLIPAWGEGTSLLFLEQGTIKVIDNIK